VPAGGIDTKQREQPRSRIRRGSALGVVDASVDKVMRVVLDYANYRRFMPHFQASRVLSRRGSDALLYIQVTALGGLATLWAEMRVRALEAATQTRVVLAHMIKGNLAQFEADWQVTPINATQTAVLFELCADPNFPLPFASGLVSDQNESEARSTIVALRAYVAQRSLAPAR
jgi:ribosome-associated toxin RatA of RatAB toxin-antitoxin module